LLQSRLRLPATAEQSAQLTLRPVAHPTPEPQGVSPIIPPTTSLPTNRPVQSPTLCPTLQILAIPPTTTTTPSARATFIHQFINSITLSGRTLSYPSNATGEERVLWLIDVDIGTNKTSFISQQQYELALRQRYALTALWFQVPDGFSRFTSAFDSTWATSTGECGWLNIACSTTGSVTYVDLDSDAVNGNIPADLGLLTVLTRLALGSNVLTGTIPSSLGSLTDLYSLDLHSNALTGTIPSTFTSLTLLTSLYVYSNDPSGTLPLCSLTQSLTYLVADCTEVSCPCCTQCCPIGKDGIPGRSCAP
jgi:Leucine rich repeat